VFSATKVLPLGSRSASLGEEVVTTWFPEAQHYLGYLDTLSERIASAVI